ncbi:sensor histidine kinase [Mucilaginibacter gilvus]|uniref:histidine kinase n=1 Tax=Mucilaginibacter gilvus TaxID=2305909 RepID=A0A444MU32_9SPHI|nr:PAS domain S-box protein [Mucilaginibacter gilvus]RWY57111.1 PAS domain S-box protein [Mucilaginibacter gilvus]
MSPIFPAGNVITLPGNVAPEGDNLFAARVLDNLPVAVYNCNAHGFITSYNLAAVKLWGRTPQIGRDLWCGSWKIYNPDGSPMPLDNCPMAKTLATGIAVEGEEILIERPDGSTRYVLPHPVPIYAGNKLIGATNTLIDITEHKADETKQAVLAAIIESSDDAIISKTLDGIITSWNRGAEKLFGYSEAEVIGKHISILIPHDRLQEEAVIIEKVRNSEKVDHFETIRLNSKGAEIPISLTVSPIKNKKGLIIGGSKIARDISKQKQAETDLQRYADNLEILNSVGRLISAELDIQSILQKVTDATTQLTGAAFGAFFHNLVDKKGESYMLYTLSGAPREAFEKFGMPRNTQIFHQTFSGAGIVRVDDITKDPRYGHNHPHKGMPEGHLPVVSYLAVPVTSKSGAVLGGLFFGHPQPGKFTSEHEKLISAVAAHASVALDNAKLYEEITLLNSKKDDFIGMASHELKTPVTSIQGYLQIVERSLANEDKNKLFVTKARNQVGKLAALIADLLDVSKIQTGKLPFSYSQFNAEALIAEVIEMMRNSQHSHQILLEQELNNLVINADQQRLEQVIINLVSNAIKYSPNAKEIIVRANATPTSLHVSVQDFGIGIDKSQQGRVFTRFYRVENLAAHMSGLGIGLYISHEIVNRHNGKIWLQSSPGAGTTFHFEVPINH